MKVKAAPGIQVPKEDNPREYISEADDVEVPHSAYYLRIVAEGDLIVFDGRADTGVTGPVSESMDSAKKTTKKEGE
ncbi:DUF2635 domain-containing protein [Paludibacterium sp. B53371]|uniref:DUF2635 domain-containing protein n=1 Tax=Paludibacterium sp. B53371 TaxID=2806263 RepID=UPI00207B1B6B|nr:DUF2635 domain-containing protein [Paludibacterium sp. B53371]